MKIRVEGYSPERFLNLCNVNKILLWGIETDGTAYEMYVSVRDYKRLRPFVKKTGTKIILLKKYGLPFFLHKFRKRKLFFAGMFFCAAAVYMLSLFIWNIHIEGNATQSTEELLAFLETLGVEHGKRKSAIVCETIETKLRSEYPNILWVSAELKGTRILIQIRENTDKDIVSQIEEKNTEPLSILSETAGIVESIIVRKGTPLVKAGDEVAAGQTLVEGYYAVVNDAGEIVRYEGVSADADIFVLSVETYKDRFPSRYEKKIHTKRKRYGITLHIFDKAYDFTPKLPFAQYDTVKKQYEIHVTENFYLPFSAETRIYQEFQTQSAGYEKEKIRELAKERFIKNYEIILQKGVQIIEKDVKININGKFCNVSGTVKLLVPAVKKVPAQIPETEGNTSQEGEN